MKKGPWSAEIARETALSKKKPVATRVCDDCWVVYPPIPEDLIQGGYRTQESAVAVSEKLWGKAPMVVERIIENLPPPKNNLDEVRAKKKQEALAL